MLSCLQPHQRSALAEKKTLSQLYKVPMHGTAVMEEETGKIILL